MKRTKETEKRNCWGIGIGVSTNLVDWKQIGEVLPSQPCDQKGLCAPCARVIDGKVHLFYQSYGTGKYDAICHAVSTDGVNFTKNATNPIFSPEPSNWTCGRAIDAEMFRIGDDYFLYYATRDPEFKNQLLGVAKTPVESSTEHNFDHGRWQNVSTNAPIMEPRLSWEGKCIEGASVISRNGKYYLFYAGSYNNAPQQIGVAVSEDGVQWKRLSDKPFLPNGAEGEWNHSESGHPHIFDDPTTGRSYLFFQGNKDHGKTWYLSQKEVVWDEKGPKFKE